MRSLSPPRTIPVPRTAAVQPTTEQPTAALVARRGIPNRVDQKYLTAYMDWQATSRRLAHQVGAASFTAGVIADCCARCDVFVEVQNKDGDWEQSTAAQFVGLLDAYCNPLQEAQELIRMHAWHYQVAGELLQTQVDGQAGIEYGIFSTAAAVWDKPSQDLVTIKLIPNGKADDGTAFVVPRAQVVRMWVPDHEWAAYAWSPMAASIDDLKRWRSLARTVQRNADSALAMNGMLWAPGGPFEVPPVEADNDDDTAIGVPKNALEDAYYQAALMRLNEDDDVSVSAPYLVHWDKEEGVPQYIKMGEPLDPSGIAHRKEAIEDFARSSNLPVTTVIGGGVGDANHWSEWLASDKFVDVGVAPTMDRITHLDLTRTVLWPRLKMIGWSDLQVRKARIGYDATPIIVKPDQSDKALRAWMAGLLGIEPTLEALGFDPSTSLLDPARAAEKEWLMEVLSRGAAGQAQGAGNLPGQPPPAGAENVTALPPSRPLSPAQAASVNGNGHGRDLEFARHLRRVLARRR